MREDAEREIRRRCDVLIKHAKRGEIATGMSGSLLRFRMALCLIGYPFTPKEKWMTDDYVQPVLSVDEYHSDEYDALVLELFEYAYDAVNGRRGARATV